MGLGYCDAQCPHDLKFINSEANMENWVPSETDKNAGTGKYGSCCTEIDLWEANKMPLPTPCTLVLLENRFAVMAQTAATTERTASRAFATITVVTSNPTGWASTIWSRFRLPD